MTPDKMCSPKALGKCPVCGGNLDYAMYLDQPHEGMNRLEIMCCDCYMGFWLLSSKDEESTEFRWQMLIDKWLKLKDERRK